MNGVSANEDEEDAIVAARAAQAAAEKPWYRYYVLAILTVVMMFSIADRLVFSILVEDIKADFKLSDTQIGLLAGAAFSVTYVLFGFVAARLADRSSRKNITAAAIAFWSLMTAISGAATGYWTLFMARVGVGMGEAASGPASQSLISDYFRRGELGRAMGFLTIGATLGTAGGMMAGGLLAEAYGWRMAFLLFGIPGIIVGLILFFTVREPIRGRYAARGARVQQTPVMETLRTLLTNKVYVGVVAAWAIQIMMGYAMAIWMPAIMLRNFEISTGDVALYLGLTFLAGGIPGPLLSGILVDYLTRFNEYWRALLPGIASLLCLIPLWLSLNATSLLPFLGFFALAYALFTFTNGPVLSLIQSSVEPAQRGFAVAFALFWNNIVGQMFGAGLIGYLSDGFSADYGPYGLNLAVIVVAGFGGAAGFLLFWWTAQQMKKLDYLARINSAA